ncbi:YdeI/OmpD-associated family protein [Rhodosalinus sp.]|uniref:YdeI/OmpD-associated family protein n=1 Tax=Rhodosalinus sp. TaxID=2047741 RepID=UPI00397DA53A
MPRETGAALDGQGLRGAFDARPPRPRHDWLGWIATAKKPGTRARRRASISADLEAGHGYTGLDWHPKR